MVHQISIDGVGNVIEVWRGVRREPLAGTIRSRGLVGVAYGFRNRVRDPDPSVDRWLGSKIATTLQRSENRLSNQKRVVSADDPDLGTRLAVPERAESDHSLR